jgi:hypothetical protein
MTMHTGYQRASTSIRKTLICWVPLVQLHPRCGYSTGNYLFILAITGGAMQDPTLLLLVCHRRWLLLLRRLWRYQHTWLSLFSARIIDINAQFETQAGLMIQELYDYQLLTIRIYLLCLSLLHSVADDQILGVLDTVGQIKIRQWRLDGCPFVLTVVSEISY